MSYAVLESLANTVGCNTIISCGVFYCPFTLIQSSVDVCTYLCVHVRVHVC